MKIPLCSLLACLALATPLTPLAHSQTSTAAVYSEAQRAYMGGNMEGAKEKFLAVLSAEPEHVGAKNYLKSIAAAEKKNKKNTLSTRLNAMIVPKISFKEASFESVLKYLQVKAGELSEQKVAPSFVLQMPPDAKQTPITLELSNVPFTEVLRYLGDLTSTKFDIQEYAIVVTTKA